MNNILILCAGTRVELVQYFKETFAGHGNVICTDSSAIAPTLYVADKGYVVPDIFAKDYFSTILDICKKEAIQAVFSLIDPELSLLAKHRAEFEAIGVLPIISSQNTVDICFDKYQTAQYLKSIGLPYIPSYLHAEDVKQALQEGVLQFPLFQKPNTGSCSVGIKKIESLENLEIYDGAVYQECMRGKEYGVDVFADLQTGKVVDLFMKEKLLMRAGETDKSISVHNEALQNTVVRFVESLGFRGQIDIDVFEKDGAYYISEINPRFGGGYLHAYACGVNFPKYILNHLQGKTNPVFQKANYAPKQVMMKYLTIITKPEEELLQ